MTDTNSGFGGWATPNDDMADAPAPAQDTATPAAPSGAPQVPPPPPGAVPQFTAADDAYSRFKPGIITLRPLTFGQLLDGGIKGIRHNPKVMLGINLLITLASIAVLFGFGSEYFATTLNFDAAATQEFSARAIILYFVGALLSSLVAVMVTVVTSVSIGRSVIGEVVSVREAWSSSVRRLPTVLAVTLLLSLAITVSLGVIIGIIALFAVLTPVLGVLVGILLGLGYVVVLVWIGIKLSLAVPAAVLEKVGPIKAFRRSWELTKENFWIIFATLLVATIITSIIQQVMAAPVAVLLPLIFMGGGDMSPLVFQLALAAATAVGAYVSYVYVASVTAIIYINQRMRREGFDLTLARAVADRQARASAAGI